MSTLREEASTSAFGTATDQVSRKSKLLALLEVLLVFAGLMSLDTVWGSTGIVQWEKRNLGWSYTMMLWWVGIPALIIWLTGRNWTAYGVSSVDWQTNLDIGIKAFLVRFIPYVLGYGGAMWLGLDSNRISGGLLVALMEVIALAVMVVVLNRHKPVRSGRRDLTTTVLLLLVPVCVALAMRKLSVMIASTIVWQFLLSGFGEEFAFRGYFQSRLNQAFGRPMHLFGIQFGAGLIVASLLFGLWHVDNTYDPAIGFSSLAWGWVLSTFAAGLFFGLIREKTATLMAPGLAHGLPGAIGEPLMMILSSTSPT